MKPICWFVFAAAVLTARGASAADAPQGSAVLAKPGGEALAIWDASPVVTTIVKTKLADPAANDLLERDAIRELVTMAPLLEKNASSITMRITYGETGAVSPVYGHLPFAGIELYATLTAPAAAVESDRDAWKSLPAKAAIPTWFEYKVVGALPPRG